MKLEIKPGEKYYECLTDLIENKNIRISVGRSLKNCGDTMLYNLILKKDMSRLNDYEWDLHTLNRMGFVHFEDKWLGSIFSLKNYDKLDDGTIILYDNVM